MYVLLYVFHFMNPCIPPPSPYFYLYTDLFSVVNDVVQIKEVTDEILTLYCVDTINVFGPDERCETHFVYSDLYDLVNQVIHINEVSQITLINYCFDIINPHLPSTPLKILENFNSLEYVTCQVCKYRRLRIYDFSCRHFPIMCFCAKNHKIGQKWNYCKDCLYCVLFEKGEKYTPFYDNICEIMEKGYFLELTRTEELPLEYNVYSDEEKIYMEAFEKGRRLVHDALWLNLIKKVK